MLADFLTRLDEFTDRNVYLLLAVFALGMLLVLVGLAGMAWSRFMSRPLELASLTDDEEEQ